LRGGDWPFDGPGRYDLCGQRIYAWGLSADGVGVKCCLENNKKFLHFSIFPVQLSAYLIENACFWSEGGHNAKIRMQDVAKEM
jgi:hypothetical protein